MIGIDIASVDGNKPVDWAAAYAAGVRFAFFRGSYEKWADPTWAHEAQRAREHDIVVGGYLFPVMDAGHPSPEEQVGIFAAVMKVGASDLPWTLDVEFPHGVTPTRKARDEKIAWSLRAIREMKRLSGVAPFVYSSFRVMDGEDADSLDADQSTIDQREFAECPLWLARYVAGSHKDPITHADGLAWPPVPKAWGDHTNVWIHQYQGDAIHVPGFSSTVDLNRFFSLQLGSAGARVAWVQRRLGMAEGTPGVFDQVMHDEVVAFQVSEGLVGDGVIGPKTFARLCWSHPIAA